MLICEGRAQDAGGVNVVESASVVVGCDAPSWPQLFAGHSGVWRARRWFRDISIGSARETMKPLRVTYGIDVS